MVRVRLPGEFPTNSVCRRDAVAETAASGRSSHHAASDLTHLVLDLPPSVGALIHGTRVNLDEERGVCRAGHEALGPSYGGQVLVVLACPVDVHPAGNAVPLVVWCFRATLRALHRPTACALRPAGTLGRSPRSPLTMPSWPPVVPVRFHMRARGTRLLARAASGQQALVIGTTCATAQHLGMSFRCARSRSPAAVGRPSH